MNLGPKEGENAMATLKHRTGADVVGLIRVGKCETNISRALQTCHSSGITTAIVVDGVRNADSYAKEPLVASKHVKVFVENDITQAERRLSEASCLHAVYVLDLPPTFLHMGRGLVEIMLQSKEAVSCRQLAVAPRFQTPEDQAGVGFLFLLTHLVWAFFTLVNRWTSYRGTYAILRRVTREVGTATITYDQPGMWRKMDGAFFGPVTKA